MRHQQMSDPESRHDVAYRRKIKETHDFEWIQLKPTKVRFVQDDENRKPCSPPKKHKLRRHQ